MTSELTCRRCQKPLGEVTDFDPAGVRPDGSPSYMHPACASAETKDRAERRAADLKRLQDKALWCAVVKAEGGAS
jgi:hypothetical protein